MENQRAQSYNSINSKYMTKNFFGIQTINEENSINESHLILVLLS